MPTEEEEERNPAAHPEEAAPAAARVPPALPGRSGTPTRGPLAEGGTPTRGGGEDKGKGKGNAGRSVTPARGAPPELPVLVSLEQAQAAADGAWASKVDAASGRTYYVNAVTKESRWQPPPDITAGSFEAVFAAAGDRGNPRP